MHTDYHLFLSYARLDNQEHDDSTPGWVTAFHDHLQQQHRHYAGRPLQIFFDKSQIKSGHDWEQKIRAGLRSSRLMLCFLSPNFFKSEWCRKEWEEYLRLEHSLSRGGDGIMPIYFQTMPGLDEAEQDRLQENLHDWVTDLRKRQLDVDLRDWNQDGAQILREMDAADRLAALRAAPQSDADKKALSLHEQISRLDDRIRNRLDEALLAEMAGGFGNLPNSYSGFVGRHTHLSALHHGLLHDRIGLVCALHGLGGQGKTALAVQYAYAYAGDYATGGRWRIVCEGEGNILNILTRLLQIIPPGHQLKPEQESLSEDEQIQICLHKLHDICVKREAIIEEHIQSSDQWMGRSQDIVNKVAPRMLLVLDNVDKPELLSAGQLGALPQNDWLRIVVTTRLGSTEFGMRQEELLSIGVDDLPAEDAMALLHDFCAFDIDSAEEKTAREIVRILDGFTLAVELIGAHVRATHDAGGSYMVICDYLRDNLSETMAQIGHGAQDKTRAEKRANTVALIMEQTVGALTEAERCALGYAAFFPPDMVATNWLRQLVAREFPEFEPSDNDNGTKPLYGDPWQIVLNKLEGRALLTPLPRDNDNAEPIARIHRLIADYMLHHMPEEVKEARLGELIEKIDFLSSELEHKFDEKPSFYLRVLPSLNAITLHLLEKKIVNNILLSAIGICAKFEEYYGSLSYAINLLETALLIYNKWRCNKNNIKNKRLQSILLSELAYLYYKRRLKNDSYKALKLYKQALHIRMDLAKSKKNKDWAINDLLKIQSKLGDFYYNRRQLGDNKKAYLLYNKVLRNREKLVTVKTENTLYLRQLANSQERMADYYNRRGKNEDNEKAHSLYIESLINRRKIANIYKNNIEIQSELSNILGKLGDLLQQRDNDNDIYIALQYYKESALIEKKLLLRHESNIEILRNFKISQYRLCEIYRFRWEFNDCEKAIYYGEESIKYAEKLLQINPDSTQSLRDLSIAQESLGAVYQRRNRPQDNLKALRLYKLSEKTIEKLVLINPYDGQILRDLSITRFKIGNLYFQGGKIINWNDAIEYLIKASEIDSKLVQINPEISSYWWGWCSPLNTLAQIYHAQSNIAALQKTKAYLRAIVKQYESRNFPPHQNIETAKKILAEL